MDVTQHLLGVLGTFCQLVRLTITGADKNDGCTFEYKGKGIQVAKVSNICYKCTIAK